MAGELEVRSDPYTLLAKALDKGVDAEQLSKFMDLQERYERNQAAAAYAEAITKFQSIVHAVYKRRTASVKMRDNKGEYSYAFASFDDVMLQIGSALAECELAVTFNTSCPPNQPGFLEVLCSIRHGIHIETSSYTLPIPVMTVNDTQRFGAAVSYGKRYAIIAALNLVVTDQDDDAAGLADVISQSNIAVLEELLFVKAVKMPQFCQFFQIEKLEHMCSRDYGRAVDFLRRKKTARTEAEIEEWKGGRS